MRLEVARRFPVPVERGFAFVTDTVNWPSYWPGYVRLEDGSTWGAVGDTARLVIRLLGRERTLTMKITSFEPNRLVTYTSTQPGLPDAAHERHFEPDGDGFLYRLVVEYEPRTGVAGLADRTLVARGIRQAFDRTLAALERELVGAPRASVDRIDTFPRSRMAPSLRGDRHRARQAAADQPRALVGRVQRAPARSRRRRDDAAPRAGPLRGDPRERIRRVLHGSRRRPARARGGRPAGPLRGRHDADAGARRDPEARRRARHPAVEALEARPPAGTRRGGIDIAGIEDCSDKELAKLETFFEREIYPVLTPLAVGPGQPFPYISGLSLSLGVLASDPASGEERFARVKVPEGLDRFVTRRQAPRPPGGRDRPLPPDAVPWDGDPRARGVPRHPRRRLRGLRRRGRPPRGGRVGAPPATVRGRRPPRALELGVARDARAARRRARRPSEPGLRGRRTARPGRPLAARRRSTGRS